MKKSIILSVLLTIAGISYASEKFDFSIDNSLVYKNLYVTETVYENGSYLSSLKWKQPFNLSYDLNLKFSFYNFIVNGFFNTGIPMKNGTMQDYDYLTTNPDEISNYSEHDNYLDKYYSFGIDVNYDIKVGEIHIIPGIRYSYSNIKFTAQDGFYQYPLISGDPWTGDEEKTQLTGNIISYEQSVYYPSVTLDVYFDFLEYFSCGITSDFKFLGLAHSLDSHYLRQVQFYDYLSNGMGFNIGTYITYKFNKMKARLDFGYDYYWAKGNSAEDKIGTKTGSFIKSDGLTSELINRELYVRLGIEIKPFN